MSVRPAKFGDIPRLVELMVEMCGRSRYAGRVNVAEGRVKSITLGAIKGHPRRGCLFVGERDEVVESFIVGAVDWIFGIGDRLAAVDPFFYASPRASARDTLVLAASYEEWARSVDGIYEARLTALDSLGPWDGNEKLYRRLGFSQEGVLYRKEFAHV